MEINITKFYNEAAPTDYSASQAEIGWNAGRITWEAAKEDAGFFQFIDTPEKVDAFKRFVLESGGWNQSEIDAWSVRELNALFLQWVAGDIREMEGLDIEDWQGYYDAANKGFVSGRLWEQNGQVYFSLD